MLIQQPSSILLFKILPSVMVFKNNFKDALLRIPQIPSQLTADVLKLKCECEIIRKYERMSFGTLGFQAVISLYDTTMTA